MNEFLSKLQEAQHELWYNNLEVLRDFIEDLEEKSLDLSSFCEVSHSGNLKKPDIEHTCGSVACIGGWVAVMPHFKSLGIKRDAKGGFPCYRPPGVEAEDEVNDASMFLFGVDDMFEGRTGSEEVDKHQDKSDKQIALRRIKKRMRKIEKLEAKRIRRL